MGFLPLLRKFWKDDPSKWFCSHLVSVSCSDAGINLFSKETPLYKISPGLITMTPVIKPILTVTTQKEWETFLENYDRNLN